MGAVMRKILICCLLLCSYLTFSQSELEILFRCYGHLTSKKLSATDPIVIDVKNGIKTGAETCKNILDGMTFTGETLTNPTDEESISILDTFQRLHYSWFQTKDYSNLDGNTRKGFSDLMTPENISTRMSRTLFLPSVNTDSILSGSTLYEPSRSNGEPVTGVFSGDAKSEYFYGHETSLTSASWSNVAFPDIGDITGFKTMRTLSTPLNAENATELSVYSESKGAGLIGHPSYIAMNAGVDRGYRTNGTNRMLRKWAVAVFQDFLCKEMPNLRYEDIISYVKPSSSVSFRQNATCVNCHASMDQMSGVMRNFRGRYSINKSGNPPRILYYSFRADTNGSIAWPDEPDDDYENSTPEGKLYYRSFKGDLVDINVSTLDQLGIRISEQEDFYYCMASKYLNYFTGVKVNLNDHYLYELTPTDEYYKKIIIELGDQFKSSKDPKALIKSILDHPIYQKKDYGYLESLK